MDVRCPYCNAVALLVGGQVIYPRRPDLRDKQFYQCAPCDAYVGCHMHTTQPLGRLANAELRKAKMAAHTAFDSLWKTTALTRSDAYTWLAEQLGLAAKDCHIGLFDVEQCNQVVRACNHLPKKWP